MGLKGKVRAAASLSIALACLTWMNAALAEEPPTGLSRTAAEGLPNRQERGRPGDLYDLPGSAGAQSYGKTAPAGPGGPAETTPPSGTARSGARTGPEMSPGRDAVPGAEPPSVRDEEDSLRREPGAGGAPSPGGNAGGSVVLAARLASSGADAEGAIRRPVTRSGPGANEPEPGYGARTDMATEQPGESGTSASELPPGARLPEQQPGSGEARIVPRDDAPGSGSSGGMNQTERFVAAGAGQAPESTRRETGRSDELMRRAKESGNAQSGGSVGTERESGGGSKQQGGSTQSGSANSGWTAEQPGERVIPPSGVLRSDDQGPGEATGAPGDAAKRRPGPAGVDDSGRLLAAGDPRAGGGTASGRSANDDATDRQRLDRQGEGGAGAVPGWGGSGESGTSDATGRAWTASPPASGVERGLGTTEDPDRSAPPPPGGLSNQPPFSGTGPAGSSRVYESGPLEGGQPGDQGRAREGGQTGKTAPTRARADAGPDSVGPAPGSTQTISGVVQPVGPGFVLLGADGQRYELVMTGGRDAAGLAGKRVTVTGEVSRSDLPASGAAGAVSSRNVIRVRSVGE